MAGFRRDISYCEFDEDIDRLAGALADEEVIGAQIAAVSVSEPYLDCPLLVALTRLAVGSLTLTTSVANHVASKVGPDFMITDAADRAQTWIGENVLHVSTESTG